MRALLKNPGTLISREPEGGPRFVSQLFVKLTRMMTLANVKRVLILFPVSKPCRTRILRDVSRFVYFLYNLNDAPDFSVMILIIPFTRLLPPSSLHQFKRIEERKEHSIWLMWLN